MLNRVISLEKARIINIFGSSGSGSTTLAKAIAKKYGYHFIDTDDAIWEKTDPPFSVRKSDDSAREFLAEEMEKDEYSVISGAFVGWADDLKDKVSLFVYLNLPLSIRRERIRKREQSRFAGRVQPGGDLYQRHLDFLDWISQYDDAPADVRGRKQHIEWLSDVRVPVISITEPLSIGTLVDMVGKSIYKE